MQRSLGAIFGILKQRRRCKDRRTETELGGRLFGLGENLRREVHQIVFLEALTVIGQRLDRERLRQRGPFSWHVGPWYRTLFHREQRRACSTIEQEQV